MLIPQTYEQWRHCITDLCKISLTEQFINRRIAILENRKDPETIGFIKLYGEQHLQYILEWYRRALRELGR